MTGTNLLSCDHFNYSFLFLLAFLHKGNTPFQQLEKPAPQLHNPSSGLATCMVRMYPTAVSQDDSSMRFLIFLFNLCVLLTVFIPSSQVLGPQALLAFLAVDFFTVFFGT